MLFRPQWQLDCLQDVVLRIIHQVQVVEALPVQVLHRHHRVRHQRQTIQWQRRKVWKRQRAEHREQKKGGKTLVVYYSASGRTRDVAEAIADAAGADIFEVVPTEPYTDEDLNWTNNDSRVSREHNDESLRDVELTTTEVPDWDSYDTVLIGYPIWWGIAAWPLDNFVKDNDFTGKTVIPFCTSASSGIGDSGNLLEEMAGTGDWQDGQRFRSNASASDVQAWVEELGLAK